MRDLTMRLYRHPVLLNLSVLYAVTFNNSHDTAPSGYGRIFWANFLTSAVTSSSESSSSNNVHEMGGTFGHQPSGQAAHELDSAMI